MYACTHMLVHRRGPDDIVRGGRRAEKMRKIDNKAYSTYRQLGMRWGGHTASNMLISWFPSFPVNKAI